MKQFAEFLEKLRTLIEPSKESTNYDRWLLAHAIQDLIDEYHIN